MSEKKTDPDKTSRTGTPQPVKPPVRSQGDADKPKPPRPDPTRYGDWEKNGQCIDF